jgi:hypothetical protein
MRANTCDHLLSILFYRSAAAVASVDVTDRTEYLAELAAASMVDVEEVGRSWCRTDEFKDGKRCRVHQSTAPVPAAVWRNVRARWRAGASRTFPAMRRNGSEFLRGTHGAYLRWRHPDRAETLGLASPAKQEESHMTASALTSPRGLHSRVNDLGQYGTETRSAAADTTEAVSLSV